MWLAALRATVSTVRCASRFVPAFVQDFESAGGYETVGYMVRRSSIDRLPAMLEQVSVIVGCARLPTLCGDIGVGLDGGVLRLHRSKVS